MSAGAIVATAGVIALQTHAQQAPVQPVVQVQNQATQTPAVAPTTTGDKVTPQDTDNIQDPGNIEKPDAPDATEVKGADANDNQAGDTDTTPDKGQDDQSETPAATAK
jgi:hypothetical protein